MPCTAPASLRTRSAPTPRDARSFFFFKQKTAYEITYGDWSSDVCSSDLAGEAGPGGLAVARRLGQEHARRSFEGVALVREMAGHTQPQRGAEPGGRPGRNADGDAPGIARVAGPNVQLDQSDRELLCANAVLDPPRQTLAWSQDGAALGSRRAALC